MNDLTIFNFKDKEIRTVMIDSEPWWVAKDICDYFGDSDHKRSVSRLDEDEKISVNVVDSLGRPQNATAVNESGLYTLLFNFQPKKARKDGGAHIAPHIQERIDKVKAFKKWVTSEVLPSIRKTGKYDMAENLFVQSKTLESKLLSTKNATGYDLLKIRAIVYGFYVHEELKLEHIKNKKAFKDFIRYLHTNPPLSTDDICKLLDISKSSFYRYKKIVEEVMPDIEPVIKIFQAYDARDKLSIELS